MKRLAEVFSRRNKALIGFLTIGYPNIETTLKAIPALALGGCDIVELGIPYSDPLADGPIIQSASLQALKNGITPEVCLEIVGKLRKITEVPLIFLTYYNPVLQFGEEEFCRRAKEAGADGFIIPDLPPEEGENLYSSTSKYDLGLIGLLAPTSTSERIKLVTSMSKGFVYLVSLTGVTGPREKLPPELEDFVKRVRKETEKPLCVGFGLSNPDEARRVAEIADGVIVGSKLLKLIEEDKTLEKLENFVKELKKAVN
jgi:tryptophan synthase alpha chain